MPGKVYLIPTILAENAFAPITAQVREVIPGIAQFYAENLRTARRYISALKTGLTIEDISLELLDKNTPDAMVSRYAERIAGGLVAGILSESGCPGIADPGAKLVKKAHNLGVEVIPISGPSSIFLALMSSGLSGQAFTFHGYLPIDSRQREASIRQLEKAVQTSGATQIFIETPYRNVQLFESILRTCHRDTLLCVACDLTGTSEFIRTMSVRSWQGIKPEIHKKPAVFLLGR